MRTRIRSRVTALLAAIGLVLGLGIFAATSAFASTCSGTTTASCTVNVSVGSYLSITGLASVSFPAPVGGIATEDDAETFTVVSTGLTGYYLQEYAGSNDFESVGDNYAFPDSDWDIALASGTCPADGTCTGNYANNTSPTAGFSPNSTANTVFTGAGVATGDNFQEDWYLNGMNDVAATSYTNSLTYFVAANA